jgi:hypothetical protein
MSVSFLVSPCFIACLIPDWIFQLRLQAEIRPSDLDTPEAGGILWVIIIPLSPEDS